jgi:ubiquinone/menaquinone biosynthesis C-methylase UbiE
MADDPYDWDSRVEAWEEVSRMDAFLALRDRLRDEASPQPDEHILDLGTGTGLITLALAPHVHTVTALDISPAMLERLHVHAASAGVLTSSS